MSNRASSQLHVERDGQLGQLRMVTTGDKKNMNQGLRLPQNTSLTDSGAWAEHLTSMARRRSLSASRLSHLRSLIEAASW